MITSLLDTDLYKLAMMQVVFHYYRNTTVEYHYIERRAQHDLSGLIPDITQAINQLCQLSFTEEELNYLAELGYFKADFINYLRDFKLNPEHIKISPDFKLSIQGLWLDTILFEVPILAIISELANQYYYPRPNFTLGRAQLKAKIELAKTCPDLRFTDFGTRRRFSHAWHGEILEALSEQLPQQFTGTSNISYAKQLGLQPVGTMAHEYIQAFQVLANPMASQREAYYTWLKEYPDALGIALSDTLGLNKFLQDFDVRLADQYHGIRQDSGDPVLWTQQILNHYKQLKLNPKTKTLVYSDSLTIQKAIDLTHQFSQETNLLFGIGTHLTNDLGHSPLDIVIKLVTVNNQPVAKISDSPDKATCISQEYLIDLVTQLSKL